MLMAIEAGKVRPGAITVVLTGNRPKIDPNDSEIRYAGLDGRLSDLRSHTPAHLMPMVSDNWSHNFSWRGNGPMPEEERGKLQSIVKQAHAAGRVVRFWETPENETVWRELRAAGVDLLNTDQLARLAKFLEGADGKQQ
jgi:glycerophosphoryl diester phosphodiesterase